MSKDEASPPPQATGDPWYIASHLLHPGGTAWSNLGLWPHGSEADGGKADGEESDDDPSPDLRDDYVAACRALAHVVGEAARMGPGDRILDVACGYGASLAYWPQAFGVARVDAVEQRAGCVKAIDDHRPPRLGLAMVGDAQALTRLIAPPESGLEPHAYDAILCVDAAYHFAKPRDFFAGCAALLKPGGHLAWTTLTKDPEDPKSRASRHTWTTGLVQSLARVPPSGILTPEETREELKDCGLHLETIRPLDALVMAGFARFVERRRGQLSLRERCSLGWWKIAGTARLCQRLYHSGTWHYTLFAAKLNID